MQVAVRCNACSVLTPMVGIRSKLACRNCATQIDFVAKVKDSRDGGVRYPFGVYYDALAEATLLLADGEDCNDARDSTGSPVTLRRVAGPTCLSCKRRLPAPAANASNIECECGDVAGVRWPDKETKSWDPRITYLVGDGLRAPQAREDRTQGALVSCGQCGAPLSGDQTDRRRARTCTHCNAVNFLGDAAILALFPQPEWHRSFLVYEVTDTLLRTFYKRFTSEDSHYGVEDDVMAKLKAAQAAMLVAQRADAIAEVARGEASPEEIEHFATDKALTAEEAAAIDAALDDEQRERLVGRAVGPLVRRWVTSANAELRAEVAENPALGRDELVVLASDPDANVRAAAATRKELPKDVLAKLRKDDNEDVVRAVKENPSYKPGFFEKLFD